MCLRYTESRVRPRRGRVGREVVTSYGGQLLVESEPGQGACFTIDLPRAERAPRARTQVYTSGQLGLGEDT